MSTGTRIVIAQASRPRLARSARLREDKARNQWTILAPERVFVLDPVALAVVGLCDGVRECTAIAADLARLYEADAAQILADIVPMLQDLADKGVIEA
jgi:pyrroloquinoline quinone biosynthesis protein D